MLNRILETKRDEIEILKARLSLKDLLSEIAAAPPPNRGFLNSLRAPNHRVGLIAEVKKASPSRGVLVADFKPTEIAKQYEGAGADCVSVLTDASYFMGSLEIMRSVREKIALPVLRKDFVIDEYQVAETRWSAADCMLLIVAAFEPRSSHFADLFSMATELGLDVLVEVHNESELETALLTNATLIGINNRDLTTFETNLATTERLSQRIPGDRLIVSESAIVTQADVQRVAAAGAKAVLVGESLVTQANIENAVKGLMAE
ncbi:MAG: indole-3-glycerol phosphate synthase TrpC [Fimbriimonadales bacterium]